MTPLLFGSYRRRNLWHHLVTSPRLTSLATTPLRFPDALPAVQCDTDLYKGIIDALMPDVFQKLAEGVVASTVAGVVTAVESGHLILNGQSMHTRNEPQHLAVATASGACLLSLHTSSSVSALV